MATAEAARVLNMCRRDFCGRLGGSSAGRLAGRLAGRQAGRHAGEQLADGRVGGLQDRVLVGAPREAVEGGPGAVTGCAARSSCRRGTPSGGPSRCARRRARRRRRTRRRPSVRTPPCCGCSCRAATGARGVAGRAAAPGWMETRSAAYGHTARSKSMKRAPVAVRKMLCGWRSRWHGRHAGRPWLRQKTATLVLCCPKSVRMRSCASSLPSFL